jgi:hypothetical protein
VDRLLKISRTASGVKYFCKSSREGRFAGWDKGVETEVRQARMTCNTAIFRDSPEKPPLDAFNRLSDEDNAS